MSGERRIRKKSIVWNAGKEEKFLTRLRQTGNVSAATEAAGVTRTFAYRKRNASRRFRQLWQEAMDEALDKLEARLWDRALGAGTGTGKTIGPDERLAIFLLKAHRPEIFSDSARHQPQRAWTSADTARGKLQKKLEEISGRLNLAEEQRHDG
ncbi:hypothetical protein [Emcibacter nanhaiensis]|uniref:Terminase n=1 Tax=Emcibacter nanhaiensis TaxID=1505037 RepID=A0A501PCM1_9PROT|nr:hypothetical protein [Emcibacter nanhaiensis]TPD57757.1 hypothetical protein FIV46_16780 [Emcibacter nanhaiensis]